MKRRDEVTVGILLTVAVIILVVGTLWLVRGGLRSGYPLYASFVWGQSVKPGQPVLLAGVPVGYVSNVDLNSAAGRIEVDLRIQNKYRVPRTAVAEVMPVGIFGDVAIALKAPPEPVTSVFAAGDTVPSQETTSGINALTAKADSITGALGRVTRAFETQFVTEGGFRDLRQTIAAMNRLTTQLASVAAEQNRNITAALASIRSTAKGIDSAQVASTVAQFRHTAASADSLMLRLSSNTTQLQAILARIERGEGTAGKFLTDSMLYRDARNLMTRLDSLAADFQRNPRKYINLTIF